MNQKAGSATARQARPENIARNPDTQLNPSQPTKIEYIPMRDRVSLYTEIYLPDSTGAFPVILLRSPYPYSLPSRNDKRPISRYTEAGYAVVFQLVRGQGLSGGRFRRYFNDANDGFDCIAWIAAQRWCDGNVGMEGPSYLGNTQLLAARSRPPALKCIMPTAFVGHFIKHFPFVGGVAPRLNFIQWNWFADAETAEALAVPQREDTLRAHPLWSSALDKRPLVDAAEWILSGDKLACWKETVNHPLDDDFWQSIHFTDRDLELLDIPMFFTAGWYDMTIGPVDFFTRLEKLLPERKDRYLLVGPWNHQQTYASHLHSMGSGEREVQDNSAVDLVAQRLAFYDCYLKRSDGATKRSCQTPVQDIQPDRVRVYITGALQSNANVWRDFPTFPAPGTVRKNLYLHSQGNAHRVPGDGSLSYMRPVDSPQPEPCDHYCYDPNRPTPSETVPLSDRSGIEARTDVLTYTTQALSEPLTLLGEISLVLHAASDARDTDWFATVTEVFPDGRSIAFHFSIAALRARYRQGFGKEVLLVPDQSYRFDIPLGPAGHQLAAGNRLRLSLFSSAFPKYDPNTNTGNTAATDTDMRVARQSIFHDADRPSHLVLPIINL